MTRFTGIVRFTEIVRRTPRRNTCDGAEFLRGAADLVRSLPGTNRNAASPRVTAGALSDARVKSRDVRREPCGLVERDERVAVRYLD
jgi:hypothetical protein